MFFLFSSVCESSTISLWIAPYSCSLTFPLKPFPVPMVLLWCGAKPRFILHYPASWGRTLRDAVTLGFRCHVGAGRSGCHYLTMSALPLQVGHRAHRTSLGVVRPDRVWSRPA